MRALFWGRSQTMFTRAGVSVSLGFLGNERKYFTNIPGPDANYEFSCKKIKVHSMHSKTIEWLSKSLFIIEQSPSQHNILSTS